MENQMEKSMEDGMDWDYIGAYRLWAKWLRIN